MRETTIQNIKLNIKTSTEKNGIPNNGLIFLIVKRYSTTSNTNACMPYTPNEYFDINLKTRFSLEKNPRLDLK